MGEGTGYRVLVGRPEGKRPLGRHRREHGNEPLGSIKKAGYFLIS
jgi:hypothetical protein